MRKATAAAMALTLWACGTGEGGGAGSASTRDSAGIRIVENQGAAWPAGAGWRIPDTSLVDIGGRGEGASELDQVNGLVRLSDGRLALANAGTNELRLFDASGTHLRSVGSTGSGPGEFQMMAGLWVGVGDSILVSDVMTRRLTVVDREGNVGRSFSLGGQPGLAMPAGGRVTVAIPQGWFGDGSVLGVTQAFSLNDPRQGAYRDSVTLVRYGADGAVRDTLGRFPGAEMEQMILAVGGRSISAPTPVPLGRQTHTYVREGRLFVARNNGWEVEVRGADGVLRSFIRASARPRAITAKDIEKNRKEQLDALEGQPMIRNLPEALKTQMKQRIEQAKYPASFPFIVALLGDPAGNLWVQEPTGAGEERSLWAVVDSTGRLLGRVRTPAHFRPTFIGLDAVFGVWRDPDEVQHVRGYPLRKG